MNRSLFLCFASLVWVSFVGNLGARPGQPEVLGEPVGTVIAQGVAFGTGAGGENQVFFATNGSPATFYAVNAETMEVVFSEPLPGLDVIWAITRGSDGDIYFAGTNQGHLFRYSPEERKLEDLGHNQSDDDWVWDLAASEDGRIYGATYPGAQIFEYDPKTGSGSSWAKDYTDQAYARGIGVSDRYVYAGVGTKTARLFRIDRKTREAREIVLPITGQTGSISDVWVYGGRLLVRAGRSRLFVLDEQTLEVIRGDEDEALGINYAISPPDPRDPVSIYYNYGEKLFRYDLEENQVEEVSLPTGLPTAPVRGWDWITLQHGAKRGRTVLVGLTEFGEMLQFDPRDASIEIKYPKVEPQGVLVQALEVGPDDRLYLGGYQAGMSVFDPATGEVSERYPQFNQPEGIGFLDGKVFFGTYGSARIFRLDPDQPRDFGHASQFNPGLVFKVGDRQDRPFAFAASEEKLFIGTVPGYGSLGGALTVFDREMGQWSVYSDLVENQSIIGLAYRDGKVYGSTSVFGGLGGKPAADAARLFVWDLATEKLVRKWAPEIPGIDQTPKAIGGLSFGPDGKLWGAAGGTIFVLDPETLEVERARTVHPSDWDVSHYWRPVYLRWAPDGRLFSTLGRQLTVIDPATLEADVWDNTSLMTLHGGYVYYAKGAKLLRLPLK